MDQFSAPSAGADKYEQLLKASDELARMNKKLIEAMQRHTAEITTLVQCNEELLQHCSEVLTRVSADGNGSSRLEQLNG